MAVLVSQVPILANAKHYGEIVLRLHQQRQHIEIGRDLIEAGYRGDDEAALKAEQRLLGAVTVGKRTYSTEDLAEIFTSRYDAPREVFRTPWPRFNKLLAGGFRRGSLTVLSGYSSHGKSIVLDQILQQASEDGKTAHLWMNEMTPEDRNDRTVARLAQVDFGAIIEGKLGLEDLRKTNEALQRLPFGVTDCTGWSAEEIARDIRARKPDIAGVDIFQKLPGGQQVWELDEKSRVLNDAAKASMANCHILLAAHVTKPTVRDGQPQPPNASNLRGTGALENDADYVVFVHRHIRDGRRSNESQLEVTKARGGGQPGKVKLTFEGHYQQFIPFVAKQGVNAIDDTKELSF